MKTLSLPVNVFFKRIKRARLPGNNLSCFVNMVTDIKRLHIFLGFKIILMELDDKYFLIDYHMS